MRNQNKIWRKIYKKFLVLINSKLRYQTMILNKIIILPNSSKKRKRA